MGTLQKFAEEYNIHVKRAIRRFEKGVPATVEMPDRDNHSGAGVMIQVTQDILEFKDMLFMKMTDIDQVQLPLSRQAVCIVLHPARAPVYRAVLGCNNPWVLSSVEPIRSVKNLLHSSMNIKDRHLFRCIPVHYLLTAVCVHAAYSRHEQDCCGVEGYQADQRRNSRATEAAWLAGEAAESIGKRGDHRGGEPGAWLCCAIHTGSSQSKCDVTKCRHVASERHHESD